jgi:rsbT co-antagonist protein RsbR
MPERSHGDPRADQIRDLVQKLLPPPPAGATSATSAPLEGDALDQALEGLRAFVSEPSAQRPSAAVERRLNELLGMIVALVSFDYDKRASVSDQNDVYDHFASGLNMLAEELSSSTVSKDYVNNIIESMSDLLVVTDGDAHIKTVNQAACDLLSHSRGELIARPIEMLFTDLSALDLLKTGGIRDQERDCIAKGGRIVRVSFSASVLRDKRGEALGLVCVARDLTENKRLEEERWRLREAVARQSILLEELSTPLIPITRAILVMPLIGTVDERRATQMVDTLLQGVVSRRTEVAIIDITGIRTMDDQGVAGVLKAVQAVRLVGAEVFLTGIRPEVARLLVAQGYDLSGIKTFGSLQNGIIHAMKRGREKPR